MLIFNPRNLYILHRFYVSFRNSLTGLKGVIATNTLHCLIKLTPADTYPHPREIVR